MYNFLLSDRIRVSLSVLQSLSDRVIRLDEGCSEDGCRVLNVLCREIFLVSSCKPTDPYLNENC